MMKRSVVPGLLVAVTLLFVLGCGGGQPASSGTTSTTSLVTTTASTQSTTTTSTAPAPTTTTLAAQIIPGVATVTYSDRKLGFSIDRPQSSSIETQGFEGFLPLTQAPVVAFVLPNSLFQGSNLVETGVYIGASSSPAITAKWNQPAPNSAETAAGTEDIGGTSFAVFTSTGAAAGNIYQEKVYRTLRDGTCFELVELLHSGNLANYGTGVTAFDKTKFQGYLEAIVATFRFVSG